MCIGDCYEEGGDESDVVFVDELFNCPCAGLITALLFKLHIHPNAKYTCIQCSSDAMSAALFAKCLPKSDVVVLQSCLEWNYDLSYIFHLYFNSHLPYVK